MYNYYNIRSDEDGFIVIYGLFILLLISMIAILIQSTTSVFVQIVNLERLCSSERLALDAELRWIAGSEPRFSGADLMQISRPSPTRPFLGPIIVSGIYADGKADINAAPTDLIRFMLAAVGLDGDTGLALTEAIKARRSADQIIGEPLQILPPNQRFGSIAADLGAVLTSLHGNATINPDFMDERARWNSKVPDMITARGGDEVSKILSSTDYPTNWWNNARTTMILTATIPDSTCYKKGRKLVLRFIANRNIGQIIQLN
jgi:hypothetical protein